MSNSFRVGSISASLELKSIGFTKGIRDAISETTNLKKSFKDLRNDLSDVGRDLSIAGAAITGFFASTVKAAADVEEAENLFTVSMGKMADSTRVWSEEMALALGLNANSIREVTGNLNVVVGNMGLAEEASAGMSKELTKLAFDMGSFYNLPHQAALEKLRAGILGESEPLKQLGIVLNETKTQAFAWANGIAEAGEELNEQQKVVARYGLIMEQTKLAQGDLARTSGSATNQFRQFKEQALAVGQTIGKDLLPPVTAFLSRANDTIKSLRVWSSENSEVAASMAKLGAGTGLTALSMGSIALGIVGAAKAFEVLKKSAAIAWAVVYSPATVTVAAIAGIGVALYTLRSIWNQSFSTMRFAANMHLSGVIEKFTALRDWVMKISGQIRQGFVGAMESIAFGASKMLSLVGIDSSGWGSGIKNGFAELTEGAEISVGKIKGLFSGVPEFIGKIVGGIGEQTDKDWEKLPEGAKKFVDAMKSMVKTPAPEDYLNLDLPGLMEGAQTMADLGEATKSAGDAAKKAAEEMKQLKEEATNMRLSVFPDEAFAEEVKNITNLATMFPEIMTGDAVAKAFDDLLVQFEDKGINAVEAIKTNIVGIAPEFGKAMEEAVERAKVASLEAIMEARSLAEDESHWSKEGDFRQRGKDRFSGLTDPGGIATMIEDTRALTEHLNELVRTGEIGAESSESILSLDHWQNVKDLAQMSFSDMTAAMQNFVDRGQEVPSILTEAMKQIAAEEWKKVGDGITNVGEGLRSLGAGAIGTAVAGLGRMLNIGKDIKSTFKDMKDAMKAAADAGGSASDIIKAGLTGVLGTIGLVIEGISLVIELFGLWGDEGKKELKGMSAVIDEIKQASDAWIDSLTDKLVDAIKTGQFAWRDFVDEILTDLTRIAIRELVVSPAVNFAGGLLGFADGGAFSKGHVVDSPEYFNTKSGPAVRGEAGTEVVMPAVRLSDGTLGVKSAGGGGSNVVVNVHDNRGANEPPVEVRQRTGQDGTVIIDMVVNALKGKMIEGDFDNILGAVQMRGGYR